MNRAKPWVQAEGEFFFLLALMLLLLPLQWVGAVVLAAIVHEACHYLAICLLGGRVYGLRLTFGGIKMEMEPLPPAQELMAALAGPLGSAALVLTARWMPRLAICGLVHCVFNLLPLFPMDGGRVLRGGMRLLLSPARAERAFDLSQWAVRMGLMGFCGYLAFRWGVFPALLVIVLLWRQRKVLYKKEDRCLQ